MTAPIVRRLRAATYGLGKEEIVGVDMIDLRALSDKMLAKRSEAKGFFGRLLTFKSYLQYEGLGREPDVVRSGVPRWLARSLIAVRGVLGSGTSQPRPLEVAEHDARIFHVRPLILIAGLLTLASSGLLIGGVRVLPGLAISALLLGAALLFEFLVVRANVAARRPPFPNFLSTMSLGVKELTRIRYVLGHDGGVERQALGTKGQFDLSATLKLDEERDRFAAYRMRFGLEPDSAGAGFIVLQGEPSLQWDNADGVSRFSSAILSVAGALDDPAFKAALDNPDKGPRPLGTQRSWQFSVPQADATAGANLSFTASLEPGQDAKILRIIVRQGLPQADVPDDICSIDRLEVTFPVWFPRVAALRVSDQKKQSSPIFSLNKHDSGSGFSASMHDSEGIGAGEIVVFFVVFERDISLEHLDDKSWLKGTVLLRHGLSQRLDSPRPRCGLRGYRYFDAFGHADKAGSGKFTKTLLQTEIEVSIGLKGLGYYEPQSKRWSEQLPTEGASTPEFVSKLVDVLIRMGIHVRQVLEDRPNALALGSARTINWNIHGRDRQNMSSPNLHIQIGKLHLPDGAGHTKIDVIVMGRMAHDSDGMPLQNVLDRVTGGILDLVEREGLAAPGEPDPKPQTRTATGGTEKSSLESAVDRLEGVASRLEQLLAKLEQGR